MKWNDANIVLGYRTLYENTNFFYFRLQQLILLKYQNNIFQLTCKKNIF